jgi:hypothetical protein
MIAGCPSAPDQENPVKIHRLIPLSVALVSIGLLTGCNEEEVASLKAEVESVTKAAAKEKADAADAAAAAKLELDSVRQELTAQRDQAVGRAAALQTDLAAVRGKVDDAEEATEKAEAKQHRLESHRDELTEWIETTLLPIAENSDAQLTALKKDASEMAAEVERIRGLKFQRPFMRRLVKREDVGTQMRRDLARDLPPEEAEKMVNVGAEFGLVPAGTDLIEMFSEFMEGGAAAFYKPDTQTFYLIEGQEGPGSRPVIFHELIHTVEDQNYDLRKLNEEREEDGDAAMALKGLTEGSADLWQTIYQSAHPDEVQAMNAAQGKPEMVQKQQQMLMRVPSFLIGVMALYPYKTGSAFLRGIGVKTPDDIAKVWADPPVSTEQVLHPEKFALDGTGRDYPHVFGEYDGIESLLGDGWEELEQTNLGELMTGLLMVHLQHPEEGPMGVQMRLMAMADLSTQGIGFKAPIAGAIGGWDGDRYVALIHEESGEVCVVWTSVWDSEDDAAEFGLEYGRLLGRKVTGKLDRKGVAPFRFTEGNGQVSGLDISGKRVVIVLGAAADKADALFAAGAEISITPDERDAADGK